MRILFLEDDLSLGAMITLALEERGFEVTYINNLEVLQNAIRDTRPALLLLDLEIGNRNTLEELPSVRLEFPFLPVIIASSHHNSREMARCYEAGANYYLVKPYEVDEVERLIRLTLPQKEEPEYVSFGHSSLNIDRQVLRCANGEEICLNPKEFHLLRLLLANRNKLVSREFLMLEVWGHADVGNSLNNYMNSLRKHLLPDTQLSLETRKRQGYIFHVY